MYRMDEPKVIHHRKVAMRIMNAFVEQTGLPLLETVSDLGIEDLKSLILT